MASAKDSRVSELRKLPYISFFLVVLLGWYLLYVCVPVGTRLCIGGECDQTSSLPPPPPIIARVIRMFLMSIRLVMMKSI